MWRILGLLFIATTSHATDLPCPAGAKQIGNGPPNGLAIACMREGEVRHGPFLTWYDNGHQKQSGSYVNNIAQGRFIEWYDNGTKHSEGSFENGEMNGVWTVWYPSGQKKLEGAFEQGTKLCPWRVWTDDAHESIDTSCTTQLTTKMPLTLVQHKAFVDCGMPLSTVEARISDCLAKNRAPANWNGRWKLVTRIGLNKEVWQDHETGLLWSSIVATDTNWCRAAGNADPKDPSTYCNSNKYQDQTSPASYCAEAGRLPALYGENWKKGVYDVSKGGMGAASVGPQIQWRLPTKEDYQQAEKNRIRFVMPDMGRSGSAMIEWSSSVVEKVRANAWVFFGVDGYMYNFIRNASVAVRCVGHQ